MSNGPAHDTPDLLQEDPTIPHVVVLIAQAAVVMDGKLHLLGVGRRHVTAAEQLHVAVIFDIPSELSDTEMYWTLDIVDADGHPVELPFTAAAPLAVHAQPGDIVAASAAIQFPPTAWPAGLLEAVVTLTGPGFEVRTSAGFTAV